ncbi:MAG: response regulator transcription factor [Myxococcales bacterium]|nr:response regulator transcription factor [Myxococcales bacterium]
MFDRDAALAAGTATLPLPSLTAIPVAVIGDEPRLAATLRTRLTNARELQLVDEPGRARVLVWDATLLERDDDGMPLLPVVETHDEAPVLLAILEEGADPMPLLALGVRGVLTRDVTGSRLRAAVLAADLGLVVLDDDPGDAVVAGWAPDQPTIQALVEPPPRAPNSGELTPREHEVLALLADGLSNRVIGDRLGISAHTVKFHVDALLAKLDARSRTAAVVEAIRRGLLELA